VPGTTSRIGSIVIFYFFLFFFLKSNFMDYKKPNGCTRVPHCVQHDVHGVLWAQCCRTLDLTTSDRFARFVRNLIAFYLYFCFFTIAETCPAYNIADVHRIRVSKEFFLFLFNLIQMPSPAGQLPLF